MQLSNSCPRRLIGATAIACAAVLIPAAALAATASPAAPAATAGTPRCATSGLDIWLNPDGGGGWAGGFGYALEFTNLSGRACTLNGYPGVSAVNLNGHQLGSPATWDKVFKPHLVTLASDATATAGVLVPDASNGGCARVFTAAGLRVYPPGQTRSKVVTYPFRECGMSVLPVKSSPIQLNG